jgi:two-component system cell cycle response regulator DivK
MLRILVIEDSAVNMALTAAILENAGHQVLRAEYAIEGMDIARIQQANLVLMDMYLPDIDGINSTRMLRADSRTAHIQVIAVTASAMQGDEDDFRAAGCDGFVTKTIRYKEFLIVLRAIELRRVTTTPQ